MGLLGSSLCSFGLVVWLDLGASLVVRKTVLCASLSACSMLSATVDDKNPALPIIKNIP